MPQVRKLVQAFLEASAIASQVSSPQQPRLQNVAAIVPSNYTVPAGYTETFEVTQPLVRPSTRKCTVDVGLHDFAYSYYEHWVAQFTPPPAAECGTEWSFVALNWQGYITGRQFDRIVQIYVGEAEVLHGTTDEPSRVGIYWNVEKDVTDFSPVFKTNQTVTVILDNIVDSTYTGVFHTHLSFDFYATDSANPVPSTVPDALIALTQPSPDFSPTLSGGKAASFPIPAGTIPPNVVRAELEYVVSNHANDEFYYFNVPDSLANPDNGVFGGGTFKELSVALDGTVVGVDWHEPVIYTGGMNPLLWRPIVHPGSSNVPSYRFDLTPFVGTLTDGAAHTVTLNVSNQIAGGNWFADAHLRLWTDKSSTARTTSAVTTTSIPSTPPKVVIATNAAGDANITTTLVKETFVNSTVTTASGPRVVSIRKRVSFSSTVQLTQQTNVISLSHNVLTLVQSASFPAGNPAAAAIGLSRRKYGLDIFYGYFPAADGSYFVNTTVATDIEVKQKVGVDLNSIRDAGETLAKRSTSQTGDGYFGVQGGASVGVCTTDQSFNYAVKDGQCYHRVVSAYNRTVSSSVVDGHCSLA
ncbi:peptide N-acetyl-beta-D-glucosaminyl asparaginase amidase A-domain-containing protein [Zopfochytrium polystomum]|nr:peptide N-acetyl-beta-D-glucosaminyl asparaginase amidase A-domain-containing protein [Zopfochytrium polystomum]